MEPSAHAGDAGALGAPPPSSGQHLRSGLLWFLAGAGFEVVVSLAMSQFGLRSRLRPEDAAVLEAFVASLALAGFMTGVVWSKARRHGGGRPRAWLGDEAIRRPTLIWVLIGLDIAYVAGTTWWWAGDGPRQAAAPTLAWWADLLLFVTAVLLGPLWEELFFRGWLWAGLKQDWGVSVAAGLTGLLWLACHAAGGWSQTLLLIPLALLLAAARQIGRSLRASFMLHAINNAVSILAIRFLVAG